MATTLLMAHYWILHKHCQPEPPPPVFFFSPSFYNSLPLLLPLCSLVGAFFYLSMRRWWWLCGGARLRPFLQVQRRPGSLPHDSLSSIHTLHLDLKRRQEKNQVTQATRSGRGCDGRGYGEGGECDPTWLLRVYIASDDKVLYDFAVFTGPCDWSLIQAKPLLSPLLSNPPNPPSLTLACQMFSFSPGRSRRWAAASRETAAESFWRWPHASSLPPLKTLLRNRSERLGRLTRGRIDSCPLSIPN